MWEACQGVRALREDAEHSPWEQRGQAGQRRREDCGQDSCVVGVWLPVVCGCPAEQLGKLSSGVTL